jgi:gliding motility-associated-like protein
MTVTDNLGCSAQINDINVEEPQLLTVSIQTDSVSCSGGSNGQATAIVSGGTNPYTYNWSSSPGNNNPVNPGLSASISNLSVTDANGCSSSPASPIVYSIFEPTPINISPIIFTEPSCNGGADATAMATVTGGNGPYSYLWSPSGDTTNPANSLQAGTQTLLVTDANGCSASEDTVITNPDPLLLVLNENDVVCYGDSTGSISAVVTGANGPYSYLWSNGATTSFITGLTVGTYSCTVTDASGLCVTTQAKTITQGTQLFSNLTTINSTCFGANDGRASVTVSNASILWWDGNITSIVNSLIPQVGVYWVQITDNATGCSILDTFNISEPDSITYVSVIDSVDCHGGSSGSINLLVNGGTPNYTYTLYDASVSPLVAIGVPNLTGNFGNLLEGVYSYDIIDAQGCSTFIPNSDTIFEPDSINPNEVITLISCFGGSDGSISIAPTGENNDFTYFWSTSGNTSTYVDSLGPISYTLTISPTNGCPDDLFFYDMSLYQPLPLSLVIDSLPISGTATAISCFGLSDGQAIITPNGGTAPYTYLWDDPLGQTTNPATGLIADTYSCVVSDINGCKDTVEITLSEPDLVTTGIQVTDVTCNGFNNGYAQVIPGGISNTTNFEVFWNSNANLGQTDSVSLGLGTHLVQVQNTMNGCFSVIDTFEITEPSSLAYVSTTDSTSCYGSLDGNISVTVSGGTAPYTYLWNDPSAQTTSNATVGAGIYICIVTDANGCQITTSNDTVFEPDSINPNAVISSISCFGGSDGSILISPTGENNDFTYFWSILGDTGVYVNSLGTLAYNLTITPTNGCPNAVFEYDMSLYQSSPISLVIDSVPISGTATAISCFGLSDGQAIITPNGGTAPYTYIWDDVLGQTTNPATGLAAGTYTCIVSDNSGCSETISITLSEPPLLESGLVISDASCFGVNDGFAQVNPTIGGLTFTSFNVIWNITQNSGSVTLFPAIVGVSNYQVQIVNTLTNCTTAVENFTINEPQLLTATSSVTNVTCFGGSNGEISAIVNGGTAPYTYLWDDPLGQTTATAAGLTAGIYSCDITDLNGCPFSTVNDTVFEPDSINPNLVFTDVSCFGLSDGVVTAIPSGGNNAFYNYSWSNNPLNTTDSDSGYVAASGSYTVTITDAEDCPQTFAFDVNQPNVFVISAAVTSILNHNGSDISCFGSSDGEIEITQSGGNAIDYFNVNGIILTGTNQLDNLPADTYFIDAYDIEGCTTSTSVVINSPDPVSTGCVIENISCNSFADGSVTVNPVGGTTNSGAYIVNWFNFATISSAYHNYTTIPLYPLDVLSGGQVVVIDDNGCADTCLVDITEPNSLTALISHIPPTCNDIDPGLGSSSNGSASVIVNGGTSPYTYLWNDPLGQTTATATGLTAGIYSCSITDANGCSIIMTDTIIANDPLASGLVITDISCIGSSDGIATVNPSGFQGAYSINWSDGSTGAFVDNLSIYDPLNPLTVTISDISGNNCGFVTELIQVGAPISPVAVTYLIINEPTCFSDGDGQVQLFASGGTAPYTFDWPLFNIVGSVSSFSPATLSEGTYTTIVEDVNGCTDTLLVVMTEPLEVTADITVVSSYNGYDIECNGGNNGVLTASVNGGVQFTLPSEPYSYLWTNVNNDSLSITGIINNLSAGTYQVSGSDANGCPFSDVITITDPPAIDFSFTASNYNGFNIACNPDLIGANLNGNVSGGANGVDFSTYIWNTLATSNTLSGLSAGIYTLSVSDNNGCPFDSSYIVTQPDPISLDSSTVMPTCIYTLDGTATVSPSGGVTPYTYIWSDGSTNQTATGLLGSPVGVPYSVLVLDDNGCSGGVLTIDVNSPDSIQTLFTGVTNVTCFEGNDGVLSGMSSIGGANTTYLYSINGSLPLVPALPYYPNLSAGQFTVLAEDINGCQGTTTVTISEPATINPNISILSLLTCSGINDGEIISIPTGGSTSSFDFSWSNGDNDIAVSSSTSSTLGAGQYSVIVTDANGCLGFDSIALVPSNTLSVDFNNTSVSCNGGSDGTSQVTLIGGGTAVTWIWSDGQTTPQATGLSAGNYSVDIIDNNGCQTSGSTTIIAPPTNLDIQASSTPLNCFQDSSGSAIVSILANGAGNWSYSWYKLPFTSVIGTSQQILGLSEGTYVVSVTDIAGCIQYDTVIVSEPDLLVATLSANNITCFGYDDGMVSTTVNGGTPSYTYSWTGPNSYSSTQPNITTLVPGNYYLDISDVNGCSDTAIIIINEPALLEAVSVVSDGNIFGVSCNNFSDGKVEITVNGGISPYYVTYNTLLPTTSVTPLFTFDNLQAGAGTFDIIDGNGCELLGTPIIITQPPALNIVSNTIENPSCFNTNDGSISISVSGGVAPYNFVEQSSNDLSSLSAGTYVISITDFNNCAVGPVSLTLVDPQEIVITPEVCLNSITIDVQNALGNYATTWTDETGNLVGTSNTVTNLSSGQYNVLIIDQPNGCVQDALFDIELPQINVTDAICSNTNEGSIAIQINGSSFYDIYIDGTLISENVVSSSLSNLQAGAYAISIIDDGNCAYNEIATINYVGGYSCIDPPIIISPNSDGSNDTWRPAIDVNEDISVTIYNRWGQIEFIDEDANSFEYEWNGTSNDGTVLPSADYYFIIDFVKGDGENEGKLKDGLRSRGGK